MMGTDTSSFLNTNDMKNNSCSNKTHCREQNERMKMYKKEKKCFIIKDASATYKTSILDYMLNCFTVFILVILF